MKQLVSATNQLFFFINLSFPHNLSNIVHLLDKGFVHNMGVVTCHSGIRMTEHSNLFSMLPLTTNVIGSTRNRNRTRTKKKRGINLSFVVPPGFELRSSRADTILAQGKARAITLNYRLNQYLSEQCRWCKSRLRRRRWFWVVKRRELARPRHKQKQVT